MLLLLLFFYKVQALYRIESLPSEQLSIQVFLIHVISRFFLYAKSYYVCFIFMPLIIDFIMSE